jgi:hypothetical protein
VFTLGAGVDRVRAEIVIGILKFADRGTAQVTAQGIVREDPAG